MDKTRISNPNLDPVVSELLELIAAEAEHASGQRSQTSRVPEAGTKGGIVEAILVGLGANAAWEAIRYLAVVIKERSGFDGSALIQVDGEERSLDSLDDKV